MNRTLLAGLGLLLVAGGVLTIVTAYAIHKRRNADPTITRVSYDHGDWRQQKLLTDFVLTNQDGHKFRSEEMKNKVCVVSFFFALCPSVCAQQNQQISVLKDELGPKGVKFISITCDPENDTPDKLRVYSSHYTQSNQHWQFLTGELEHIRRIGGEVFGVPLDKATHTSHLLLVDKWGKVRGRYVFNKEEQLAEMKKRIPALQKETAPPPPPKKKKRRRPNIRLDDDDDDDDDGPEKGKEKATPKEKSAKKPEKKS